MLGYFPTEGIGDGHGGGWLPSRRVGSGYPVKFWLGSGSGESGTPGATFWMASRDKRSEGAGLGLRRVEIGRSRSREMRCCLGEVGWLL